MNIEGNRVTYETGEIIDIMARWPCSGLMLEKAYWFEFDQRGDLIDASTSADDASEASGAAGALADDARSAFLNSVCRGCGEDAAVDGLCANCALEQWQEERSDERRGR